jgi:hypothetical protein
MIASERPFSNLEHIPLQKVYFLIFLIFMVVITIPVVPENGTEKKYASSRIPPISVLTETLRDSDITLQ